MKFYFFVILCTLSFNLSSQNEPEKIFWMQDGLTWSDFKALPDESSKFDANTNAGLSFSWGVRNENGEIALTYDVKSYFNPKLSWVKMSPNNDYLLKHEQLHFDISELHARKLRKKLSEVNPVSLAKDPKAVLTRIYETVENERRNMQLKYDKESRHSLDKDGEARWRHFVREELRKYEEVNS